MYLFGDYVYFPTRTRFLRVPKAGGEVENTGVDFGSDLGYPQHKAYAHDDNALYALIQSTVFVIGTDGRLVRTIELPGPYQFLAAQGDRLFFSSFTCSRLGSINKDGSDYRDVTQAVEDVGGGAYLYVDATHVYCGYIDTLYRATHDGAPEVFVSGLRRAGAMAGTEDTLYLLNGQYYTGQPKEFEQSVEAIDKESGQLSTLAAVPFRGQSTVLHLDASRGTLYWSNFAVPDGIVAVDLRTGTTTVTQAADPSDTAVWAQSAVLGDANHLYWALKRTVRRAPKDVSP